MKKNLVVLSGAGVSQESGIPIMTDATTWRNYKIHEVASQEAWERDPQLLIDFYNERRKEFSAVEPNGAHHAIKELEENFNVYIITTNVDNLHEKAGSTNVIHLHGDLLKVQSERNPKLVYDWDKDLTLGDTGEDGAQLRPNIVFFGEMMPTLEPAIQVCSSADVLIIVGTAMQVFPAAILYTFAPADCKIYVINPVKPDMFDDREVEHIDEKAVNGMNILKQRLQAKS
ncbi:MAG: SIR2 family NAD-dependent protein deacylase [Pyrinomonadaceae bacterium]